MMKLMQLLFRNSLLLALLWTNSFSINAENATEGEKLVESGVLGDIKWYYYSNCLLSLEGNGAIVDFKKYDQPSPNTSDRPWHKYRNKVEILIVKDGITRVGNRAFQNFSQLKSVLLAESVKSIGLWAFQNCYLLENVSMANDIVLEQGAFSGAPAEEDIAAVECAEYTNSIYFERLCKTTLTGDFRTDVINIALSQTNYHEGNSVADYDGGNTSGNGDYTEYGRYLMSSGNAWCSEFASWCVRMSSLPKNILGSSKGANAQTFTQNTPSQYYTWSGLSFGGGDYSPQPGDLIIWSWDMENHTADQSLSHTSILHHAVIEDEHVILYTIEGNSGGKVRESSYTARKTDGVLTSRTGQLYYLIAPNYENEDVEKYQITFDTMEGSVDSDKKTVATGGLYGPFPIPQRNGYKFLGWYTEPSDGKRINMYHPVRIHANQTLYAHWVETHTGIQTVRNRNQKQLCYNLMGLKVNQNYRGIIVKNGKKYNQIIH